MQRRQLRVVLVASSDSLRGVVLKHASIRRCIVLVVAGLLLPPLLVGAQAPPKVVTLGADLTPAQREALLARFGATEAVDKVLTITTPEMGEAMQGIIPIPEGYTSVSSTALTCGAPGAGLHVTTENITRVTAGMYAGALLTAGIGDAELIVAAPADAQAEGMTALTGIFKGFTDGACGRGEVDPTRRELAYRWLGTTAGLGNALGDQNAAARLALGAQQAIVGTPAGDPAAAEQALDRAAAETGVGVPPEQREPLLDLLRRMAQANIDWGTYASGWTLEEVSPTEVRLTPQGLGVPGAAPAGGQVLNGTVRSPLGPESYLVIDAPGQQQQLNLNANTVAVTRDGQPAQLADLQAGDSVTIQVGADNVAQRIDARSAGGATAAAGRIVVGTVNDNNEGQVTLTTAGGQQQFAIPREAYIARDGEAAELGAVQAQDSATLVISSTGDVQAVFARPGGGDYALEGQVAEPLVANALNLRVGSELVGVSVPATGVAVSRNGRAASFADIQPGDRVTVRFNAMSQPVAVDATSRGGLFGLGRNQLLPLLCLLPLLLLLGLFLWRREQMERVLLVLPGRRRRIVNPDDVDELLG